MEFVNRHFLKVLLVRGLKKYCYPHFVNKGFNPPPFIHVGRSYYYIIDIK